MDEAKKNRRINKPTLRAIPFDDVPSYKRTVRKHPTAYKMIEPKLSAIIYRFKNIFSIWYSF